MKKFHQFVKEAKYIIALENEGFDSVELYKQELFIFVSYRYSLIASS